MNARESAFLSFGEIDAMLNGSVSALIGVSARAAADYGGARAYSMGKKVISALVGWESGIPALQTSQAYDAVIERLADACWDENNAGDEVRQR